MWFLYALASAIFASFRKVNDKHLSHNVHHLHLAWMMKAAALPLLGVAALFAQELIPGETLPPVFWISILLSVCVTTPLDTAVYLKTLKHGQLSRTAPLMSLWPVVMLVMGAVFLGQVPSIAAVIGVVVIVTGVYALNTSKGEGNVFHNMWNDKGVRFGLAGIITLSINTTLGAIAIEHSSPLFYGFWATLGSAIVQLAYAQIVAPGKYRGANIKLVVQNGSLQATASTLYFYAVASGPIGYVTAIRSLGATLAAVLGARAFNEGMGKRKIVALVLIALGAVVLGLEAR